MEIPVAWRFEMISWFFIGGNEYNCFVVMFGAESAAMKPATFVNLFFCFYFF